jgi:DNA-directed RNA polymerase specialized sigma54-like protein
MKTYDETSINQTATAILSEAAEGQSEIGRQMHEIDRLIKKIIEQQKKTVNIANELAEWQRESDQFIEDLDAVAG